ncbi:inositol monophosphatase family protein [Pseudoglutamicibacter albus]|uniref:inositol monophosphatase family protein n=1 Tax=Pseudoglutamicibacter albus TaxID=98671 RepID=UPI001EF71981|nr:inositol monophosphatase family protein [Pseudoglutamicibacter albus]MCG7304435.1 inositol monophosphatase family protein [Pseudoglutamicibacter albus]
MSSDDFDALEGLDAVKGRVWPGAEAVVARLGVGEPERLRDIAVDAVAAVAADVEAAWRAGVSAQQKSSAHDVVTQTDIVTEARLVEFLRERTPQAVFLGEEGAGEDGVGEDGAGEGGPGTDSGAGADVDKAGVPAAGVVCWVIDPIDGTSNFVHGLPDFGISVAAVVDGVPVAGVVRAPALERMWRAWIGADGVVVSQQRDFQQRTFDSAGGADAWVPCASSGRGAESLCALVTDHPHPEALEVSPDAAREFSDLVQAFATVRRHVCTTVDVCRLASGVHDAVLGPAVKPWDIAAAALIAVGSGATWLYGGRRAGIPGPSSAPVALLSRGAGPGTSACSGAASTSDADSSSRRASDTDSGSGGSVLDAPMFLVHANGASVPTARKILNQMIARTLPND